MSFVSLYSSLGRRDYETQHGLAFSYGMGE